MSDILATPQTPLSATAHRSPDIFDQGGDGDQSPPTQRGSAETRAHRQDNFHTAVTVVNLTNVKKLLAAGPVDDLDVDTALTFLGSTLSDTVTGDVLEKIDRMAALLLATGRCTGVGINHALYNAARTANEALVQRLLATGKVVSQDARTRGDLSKALSIAASKGLEKMVTLLFNTGLASPDGIDAALYEAASGGHTPIVSFLAKHATFAIADRSLRVAIAKGFSSVIPPLLTKATREGVNDALAMAVFKGDVAIAKFLFRKASADGVSRSQLLAKEMNQNDMLALLDQLHTISHPLTMAEVSDHLLIRAIKHGEGDRGEPFARLPERADRDLVAFLVSTATTKGIDKALETASNPAYEDKDIVSILLPKATRWGVDQAMVACLNNDDSAQTPRTSSKKEIFHALVQSNKATQEGLEHALYQATTTCYSVFSTSFIKDLLETGKMQAKEIDRALNNSIKDTQVASMLLPEASQQGIDEALTNVEAIIKKYNEFLAEIQSLNRGVKK